MTDIERMAVDTGPITVAGLVAAQLTGEAESGEAARFFFDNAAAVQRLFAAFAKWNGTPFRRHSKAPGPDGGIDCVGFVEEVLGREVGVDRGAPFNFPRTSADYQSNRTELRVLNYLRGHDHDVQSTRLASIFAEITLPDDRNNIDPAFFMPGDLLVLREGGMFHLPVMMTPPRFAHCARPMGVAEGNIHDPTFSKHIDALFRARAFPSIQSINQMFDNWSTGHSRPFVPERTS